MTRDEALAHVLEIIESELAEDEVLGLYQFSWALGDARDHFTEPEIHDICRQAYGQVVSDHRLKLVWSGWPMGDLSDARDAKPGTTLDFSLDPDSPSPQRILALVPD